MSEGIPETLVSALTWTKYSVYSSRGDSEYSVSLVYCDVSRLSRSLPYATTYLRIFPFFVSGSSQVTLISVAESTESPTFLGGDGAENRVLD